MERKVEKHPKSHYTLVPEKLLPEPQTFYKTFCIKERTKKIQISTIFRLLHKVL